MVAQGSSSAHSSPPLPKAGLGERGTAAAGFLRRAIAWFASMAARLAELNKLAGNYT